MTTGIRFFCVVFLLSLQIVGSGKNELVVGGNFFPFSKSVSDEDRHELNPKFESVVMLPEAPILSYLPYDICSPDSIVIVATSDFPVLWYDEDYNPLIGNDNYLILNSPGLSTTIHATAIDMEGSESAYSDITVITIATPTAPVISAYRMVLCGSEMDTLSVPPLYEAVWNTNAVTPQITVPAGVYFVYYNNQGCLSEISTIEIISIEFPELVLVSASDTLCEGATTIVSTANGDEVAWSNGIFGSTIEVGPGLYSAQYYDLEGCTGMPVSIFIEERILPAPVIDVSSLDVCEGESTTLNVSPEFSVYWSTGETSFSITQPAGTYSAHYSFGGCSGPESFITLNEVFVPAPVISATDTLLCEGEQAVLSSEIPVYWSTGDFGTSTVVSSSMTVLAHNEQGVCSSESSNSIYVSVKALPEAPQVIVPEYEPCSTSALTLTASSNSPIVWFDESMMVVQEGGDTYFASDLLEPTHFYVQATNKYGCNSALADISLNISMMPGYPLIVASDTVLCGADFDSLSIDLDFEIHWSTGSAAQMIVVDEPGIYSVYYTNGFCIGPVSEIMIYQSDVPETPEVTQIDFTHLAAPDGYASYEWFFNGALLIDSTNVISTDLQEGNYQVVVYNELGCSATSESFYYSPDRVNEVDMTLALFPNPSSGCFQVKGNVLISNLTCYNALGELVLRSQPNASVVAVEAQSWSEGIYSILMETSGGIRQAKLVVKH